MCTYTHINIYHNYLKEIVQFSRLIVPIASTLSNTNQYQNLSHGDFKLLPNYNFKQKQSLQAFDKKFKKDELHLQEALRAEQ